MANFNLINSKDEMTKRERIENTLNFEKTDRVAIFDLMENPGAIEYFSGQKLKSPKRNNNYNLKIICKAIGNSLDATRSVYSPRVNRTYKNNLGFIIRQERWTSWIEKRPFKNMNEIKEFIKNLMKKVKNSNPYNKWNYYGEEGYDKITRNGFSKIQEMISDTVLFQDESPVGLDTIMDMIGIDKLSLLYADKPELVSECLEVLCNHEVKRIELVANPGLSPLVLPYCDLAYKGGLIFSPQFLRKEFFPRLKRITDKWHEYDTKCIFHSDGNFIEVMDNFVKAGVDGINPIEPIAGWDLIDVRIKYPKLVLMGNIDVSQLLSFGTVEKVKRTVKKEIDDIYPTGGLILGSSTELGPYLNPVNIITMILFAKEYSRIKPFKPRDINEVNIKI